MTDKRCSPRICNTASPRIILPPVLVPGGIRASAQLISQQALIAMTMREALQTPATFTPGHFVQKLYKEIPHYAHFASPVVHLTTSNTITSNKKLMNDPETAKVWQTAFGKDFDGMAQGDKKTGQKGTNSVFVMIHNKIDIARKAGHKWTYA
jgi:hypothetical protein